MASIVHVITKLELGGAQQTAIMLAGHQASQGHTVRLVSGVEGWLVPVARGTPGVEVALLEELRHPIDPFFDWRCLQRLTKMFREWKPEIVQTHSSKAGILGREAARRADVPRTIHTVYGWSFHTFQNPIANGLFRFLEKRAAGWTTRLVAVSEAVRTQGLAAGIGKEEQYRVIVNAIDVRRFRHAPTPDVGYRRRLLLPDVGPVVTMIGNFKPQKAPLDFIEVASRVCAAHPDVHFVFVGDGELRDSIEQAAGRSADPKRIHLVGWRGDVDEILTISDVVLHTSLWEGLPMGVLQTMAAARPVVATAVDGTVEAVVDGETGFLRPAHDVEGMAAQVGWLLSNSREARRMGEAGRRRVQHMRGADLPAMLAEYDVLIAEPSGSSS